MKNKLVVLGVGLFVLVLVGVISVSVRRAQPIGPGQNEALETGSETVTTNSVSQSSDPANWGEFVTLLKLNVLSDAERQQLESQITQLTPNEAWANQTLVDKINEKTDLAYRLRPFLVQGLGNLGVSAESAIPTILDAAMAGTAIRTDMLTPVAVALKQINPTGEKVISELTAFEARQDGSQNARYISQAILKTYDTKAAKDALKGYTSNRE